METRFRIRKVVFCLVFICLCLIGLNVARADTHPLDVLNGADVVKQGQCVAGGQLFYCVALNKDGKDYLVFLDKAGEYAVLVKKGDEWVLFWKRDSV